MRGAIPVLTRAMRVDDAHPSVGLLSGATLLAMKLVAAGRIRLSETGDSWRVGPLQPDDDDRLRALATRPGPRRHDGRGRRGPDPAAARRGGRHDGPATRACRRPAGGPTRPRPVRPRARATPRTPTSPTRSGSALRVEAPAEVLEGGGVVVVLQAHEVDDDTHVVDADQLGSAEDARVLPPGPVQPQHRPARAADGLAAARPAAAATGARPDGARRRRARGPARARARRPSTRAGIDVFWPRGLRGELIPQARVEVAARPARGPLMEGLFGPGALFEFDWRLALGDDPLTDDEMAALAGATTPVIRLRDNWMIIDPVVARRARKRIEASARRRPAGRRPAVCAHRHDRPRRRARSRCTPARRC